jgi:tRNA(fMet)-specific endonuclease VapC
MTTHILLDTSPIVAHLRKKLNLTTALPEGSLLFTSLFTVGELEKGIQKAELPGRERAKVAGFLENIAIILPDEATARTYGRISRSLDTEGRRIPENDAWIAAVALEGSMKLATGDAHFSRVDGLDVLRLSW